MLMPLCRELPSEALYLRTLGLQAARGYSFYDSLIIAAALEAGCTRLLSEDLQHGQVIEGLRIENPFLVAA
jgi:predicted nucleic acid-binding protein